MTFDRIRRDREQRAREQRKAEQAKAVEIAERYWSKLAARDTRGEAHLKRRGLAGR